MDTTKSGAVMIAAERQRQIDVEGYVPDQDSRHQNGEILEAAASYLQAASACIRQSDPVTFREVLEDLRRYIWPWKAAFFKPSPAPVSNLVKAGALIAAEIDRLQREITKSQNNPILPQTGR